VTARVGRTAAALLVGLGVVLVAAGVVLLTATPRAVVTDVGPPAAAVSVARRTVPAPSEPPAPTPDPSPGEPVTLVLPGGGAPVPVVPVGVLPTGALQLPERPTTLGWYAAGATPGGPAGTAVLAGHVDSASYGAGPLVRLYGLHVGDLLQVTDVAGAVHRFAVVSRRSYPKADLPADVFGRDGPPRLALVTCGGAFDRRTGHYADNVVVVATPA
jgi:Sortase domain